MTAYICSTHTNSVEYRQYEESKGDNSPARVLKKFVVKGGNGMCQIKTLETPMGVVTTVEKDSDIEWLEALPAFQEDIRNGYIRVLKRKEDPEKVVKKSMKDRDLSAPLKAEGYAKNADDPFTYLAGSRT
jgi:predicted methyltransferase